MLETLPHPGNTSHQFVVDPAKFDFYVMDAYRLLREDRLAETYAHEVIRASTDHELATLVDDRYGSEPDARVYLDHLRQLRHATVEHPSS